MDADCITSLLSFLSSEEPAYSQFSVPDGYCEATLLQRSRQSILLRTIDERSGADVVIKQLQPSVTTNIAVEILDWEASVLERLDGVRSPRLVEAGRGDDGRPFLVMGYVDGDTVTQRLATVPEAERVQIVALVLRALHQIHRKDVSHGDLKPEHILIDRAGEIQFLDFGLASLGNAEQPHGFLRGIRGGTRAYLSPEQIESPSTLPTVASDLYSMGLIVREWLGSAGRTGSAVKFALATEPSLRPNTAEQFAAALLDESRFSTRHGRIAGMLATAAAVALVLSMLWTGGWISSSFSASPVVTTDEVNNRSGATQFADAREDGLSRSHLMFEEPLIHGVLVPDGSGVLSVSREGDLAIYETNRSIRRIGHLDSVRHLAMSPRGDRFAATCEDGSVWIGHLSNGSLQRVSQGEEVLVSGFGTDGQLFGWSSRKRLLLSLTGERWEVHIERGGPVPVPSGGMTYVRLSRDGRPEVGLVGQAEPSVSLNVGETPSSVAVNANGEIMAVGLQAGRCLVRTDAAKPFREVSLDASRPVWGVTMSATGNRLYVMSDEVSVIDIAAGEVEGRLSGVLDGIPLGVSLSEDGEVVAATNREVRWWKAKDTGVRLASR